MFLRVEGEGVVEAGGGEILKPGTYDLFGTVGGSFLARFYVCTMYTKYH